MAPRNCRNMSRFAGTCANWVCEAMRAQQRARKRRNAILLSTGAALTFSGVRQSLTEKGMKANSRQFCFLKSMMLMSGAFGVLQIGSLELVRAEDTAYGAVDASRISDSDVEAGNWLSYGRTYSETRYSPLTLINDKNATSLGLGGVG